MKNPRFDRNEITIMAQQLQGLAQEKSFVVGVLCTILREHHSGKLAINQALLQSVLTAQDQVEIVNNGPLGTFSLHAKDVKGNSLAVQAASPEAVAECVRNEFAKFPLSPDQVRAQDDTTSQGCIDGYKASIVDSGVMVADPTVISSETESIPCTECARKFGHNMDCSQYERVGNAHAN